MKYLNLSTHPLKTQFILLFGLLMSVIILYGWICDDAFITLRVIDNFVNGYGLRWNIDERVQAYSNPLWLFLLTPFYFITREPYYTTIFISVATSAAAIYVAVLPILKGTNNNRSKSLQILLVPLILSMSFIEFSTSGLENPLSHLLMAIFLYFYKEPKKLWVLPLIASFATINRLDNSLLYIPPLLYLFIRMKSGRLKFLAAGTLPLAAWLGFCFVYYGFIFPNTYYAKLNSGILLQDLAPQGVKYIIDFLIRDPVGFTTIFLFLLIGLQQLFLGKIFESRSLRKSFTIFLSVVLYLVYIISIGGDFMSGRFMTILVFISAICLSQLISTSKDSTKNFLLINNMVIILLVLSGINIQKHFYNQTFHNDFFRNGTGIIDERSFYLNTNSLISLKTSEEHPWAMDGLLKKEASKSRMQYVSSITVGMLGYYGGPNLHIIDTAALSEPFLARIPINRHRPWRIGHFLRNLPPGYLILISQGPNPMVPPYVLNYYSVLAQITTAPVWDKERWGYLIDFHLGKYDVLRDNYIRIMGLDR